MTKVLEHYSRKEIQQAILLAAKNKEVAIRYGEKGYGKRPDTLYYTNDIHDLAKSGATSFHISEELWSNPLLLKTGMTKSQLDSIRTGWDFLIDIDSKDFEIAKKAAILFREALKFHKINSYSVKFSGNNGFHIGIPFEAFPEKFNNQNSELLFPEAPKVMASYLKEMIKEHLSSSILQEPLELLLKKAGKSQEEISEKTCKKCKSRAIELKRITYQCSRCKLKEQKFSEFMSVCPECNQSMSKIQEELFLKCSNCNIQEELDGKNFQSGKFNPFSLVDIDTVLISSRHLFRCPYSINEKSGLISLPINPESLESFQKTQASIRQFSLGPVFLNRDIKEKDAALLVTRAYESYSKSHGKESKLRISKPSTLSKSISQQYFPPCIQLGLKGIADGKKRFIFILYNFLSSTGYSHEEIEFMMHEWNKNNKEPLRENYIQAQLSWSKRQKRRTSGRNDKRTNAA